VLLSFRCQKKQYDFFGFGEEIGLEFLAGDNIFDKVWPANLNDS
jgi:hypothetical protein